jgi:hypothetical protein
VAVVEITEHGGLEILAEGLGIDERIICSSLQPLFKIVKQDREVFSIVTRNTCASNNV